MKTHELMQVILIGAVCGLAIYTSLRVSELQTEINELRDKLKDREQK